MTDTGTFHAARDAHRRTGTDRAPPPPRFADPRMSLPPFQAALLSDVCMGFVTRDPRGGWSLVMRGEARGGRFSRATMQALVAKGLVRIERLTSGELAIATSEGLAHRLARLPR